MGSLSLVLLEPPARARQVRECLALAPAISPQAFLLLSVWWILVENQLCVGEIQRQKEHRHASGASHGGWGHFTINDPHSGSCPHSLSPILPSLSFLLDLVRSGLLGHPLPGCLHTSW